MTIEIKHATQATGTEAGNGEIGKAAWNAALSFTMATARLIGRVTAGAGSAEEIAIYNGLLMDANGLGIDKATAANIRAGASNKVVTADALEAALVPTVSASVTGTISTDWSADLSRDLTATGNLTFSNPTNVEAGTTREIWVFGNNATERSISWGTNIKGAIPDETVTSTRGLLIVMSARTASFISLSWKPIEL